MKQLYNILNFRKGFVILYAVLILSVLLVLATSITNLAIRERKLSRFGEESLSAFFAAESGMECALYWDLKEEKSAFRYDAAEPGGRVITCNGQTFTAGDSADGITEIQLDFSGSSNSSIIVVDKSVAKKTSLIARGYSVANPAVEYGAERGVSVVYSDEIEGSEEDCVFDIAMVLDNSGSIGGNMGKLKTAAKQIVENNELGEDKFKFAVISFESSAVLETGLTSDEDTVNDAIDGLGVKSMTNLAGGEIITKHEFLSANNRIDVDDVAVIITDGMTNRCANESTYDHSVGVINSASCPVGENPSSQAKLVADDLKAQGVYIIVIGVGISSNAYEDYLKDEIASTPESYYSVNNFEKLKQLTEDFDCSFFLREVGSIDRREI